jgi:asparagine synthase (glutamine-hydrolysing)
MCGIAGYLSSSALLPAAGLLLKKMGDAITHRGPDDSGIWCDESACIGLSHRRLSIVDLSPAGHQPMVSGRGRYVIVFNGEIYNHCALRESLDTGGPANQWRGHSDTETLLAGFDAWGIQPTIEKTIGMFAVAVWDRDTRTLTLCRDRLGEKPLYYGWQGETFLFGSELKALKAHPAFKAEIDRNALMLYMRHCYIPAPYTIYRGIRKLLPGTTLTIKADSCKTVCPEPVPYWSARTVATEGMRNPFSGTDQEAVTALESLLLDAVGKQMMADVPLGAFLSGGVDSSTVVALMQAQSSKPVRTFTIGFSEAQYNEATHAKEVARHLGTDHTELYVSPDEALRVIPQIPHLYDEPFADSSQIPTFLVAQMTRQHVTVSLSGDAGDELFGGYNRYTWMDNIWNNVGWMPRAVRQGAANAITALPPRSWDRLFGLFGPFLPASMRQRLPGDKMHKLAGVLGVESPAAMYRQLVSTWKEPGRVVLGATEPFSALTDRNNWLDSDTITQQMMYLDLITYLPDDILTKVDRAAMGVSLETRVPFLDHRVVEFAWKLPLSMKIKDGCGKWALRQVLYKYVPQDLIERPKMGFGVPIDTWLRGPLRDWAEALLDERRLREEGFFNPQPIQKLWQEHLSGQRNWQHHLWNVLMFQAWLENERS